MEVFDQSPLAKGFQEALPPRSANRSAGSYRLGLIQLNSFIYGHDCLEDLEEFRNDPLLEAALKGEVAAPRTIGDFLRDYDLKHFPCQSLRQPRICAAGHGLTQHLEMGGAGSKTG